MVAVAVIAIVLGIRLISGGGTERFAENVYINGVSLAGYTREEGYTVMEEIRNEWLNANHVLTYGDRTWNFSPATFNAEIDFESELEKAWNFGHVGDSATRRQVVNALKDAPAYLTAELTYDEAALDAFIAQIAAEVNVEPVDAEVTLTAEKPVITRQSENGAELDVEQTKENLIALITTGEGETALPVEELVPSISSVGLEMEKIVQFSTDVTFRNSASRGNVRLALNYFNAMAVYPGDTIDFNEVVGPRTLEAGFKEAPEYAGNEVTEGVGGGVCQSSTTLYNAVIMAGMEIIERSNHSMTVDYVLPSQDAAVEYGGKNFVFRNDTEHAIYIYTEVTSETATVTIYGTRPEYRYALESIIISETPTTRVRYEDDTEGTYVYYTTDEPYLYKEGRGSCQSQGWLVAYDWDTGEEVYREQVSNDVYRPGVSVYYRGVHEPTGMTNAY